MNPFVSPDDTFEQHTFTRLAFQGEPVRGHEFHECHFIHCSLREAVFQKCRFNDCIFQDCDLSLVNLEGCTFRNTQFKTCKLIGVNWAIAKWPKFSQPSPIHFHTCTLDYASFQGLRLTKIRFTDCILREVDFSEADLTEADFSRAVLSRSQFSQTNLTRANFVGATEYLINPSLNRMSQAKFSLPEALSLLYGLDIQLVE